MKVAKTVQTAEATQPIRRAGMKLNIAELEEKGIRVEHDGLEIRFSGSIPFTDAQRRALGMLTDGLGLTDQEHDNLWDSMADLMVAAVVRSALR